MAQKKSENISPTAHYTGYVWARNGLSHPMLATRHGRLLYNALRPMNAASAAVGGPTLEGLLLARHRVIDFLLEQAIEAGQVTQVVEIAAGLSPRGWRFAQRYGQRITYIETDLAGMAARKRRLLAKMGALPTRHRVAELDIFSDDAETGLQALTKQLNRKQGLAIITEGLLNYFDTPSAREIWQRVASCLQDFTHGHYFSDLHVAGENHGVAGKAFVQLLSAFVRGRVHFHFEDAGDASLALMDAGFDAAQLHRPRELLEAAGAGSERVRIIAANV